MVVYRPLVSTSFSFAPALPAQGAVVDFTASFAPANATQPVTYTWDFGDGSAPVVTTDRHDDPYLFRLAGAFAVTADGEQRLRLADHL